ncbi:hypothetical protein BH24GEM2_BH24GEM2_12310 [soil metagenome]
MPTFDVMDARITLMLSAALLAACARPEAPASRSPASLPARNEQRETAEWLAAGPDTARSFNTAVVHGTVRSAAGAAVPGADVYLTVMHNPGQHITGLCSQPGRGFDLPDVRFRLRTDLEGRFRQEVRVPTAMGDHGCLLVHSILPTGEYVDGVYGVLLRFSEPREDSVRVDMRSRAAARPTAPVPPPPDSNALARQGRLGARSFRTPDDEWAELARGEVPGFAGVIVEGCTWVIFLRDLRHEAAARHYWEPRLRERELSARQNCGVPRFVVRQVRYDFAQLREWYGKLGPIWQVRGITMTDIDEARNRITVGVQDEAARREVERVVAGLAIPSGVVETELIGPVCAGVGHNAVNVTVEDARTGRRLEGVPVTLVVREGVYADSMRGDLGIVSAASERPGTYHVTVRAPGYRTWTAEGVKATQGRCELIPARLRARLEPEP